MFCFELISPTELVEVCKGIQIGGPIGGLQNLHQFLVCYRSPKSEENELDAFFNSSHADGSGPDSSYILERISKIIESVDVSKRFLGYEMIVNGVATRFNTERDVDVWYLFDMFKCFKSATAIHYGEPVSRASRERRQLTVPNSEGYHLDYMFTSNRNTSEQAYGHEFSGVERVGSKFNNGNKLQTDSFKLAKTLRDMHIKLRRDIEAAGGGFMSKEAANAMKTIRMVGFRTAGFTVQASVMIYAGGGFFIRKVVNDIAVPVQEMDIGQNIEIIQEMLKMKKILSSTVQNFEQIKQYGLKSKIYGSIRHVYKAEAATPEKKARKSEKK
ncbi:hypothetical protein HK096_003753 [Nowakowskiella sp. JEL0078]|nr:hypothetical protein HK096_003753 [Nowakowskiella sp. JEL0078]